MSREPASAGADAAVASPAPPGVDRRRADRRRGDRRQTPPPQEESWFGALGALDEAPSRMAASPATGPAAGDPDTTVQPDLLARVARDIVAADETAFARVFKAYAAARAALGLALVLAPWAASLLGSRPELVLLIIGLAYAAQAIVQWVLPIRGGAGWSIAARRRRQWLGTVGLDMLAFSALHLLEPRSNLNYAALLVLPVLMAGVMSTRIVSLATTSAGALVLLAGVWRAHDGSVDSAVLLTQAGLAGAGLFVISLLAGELAHRLAREERAARGSMALARQQAQLNRLVLEEMPEGVLVIDRRLRLRAANPAAQAMMGLAPRRSALPQPLDADPGWAPLQAAVEEAYAQGAWPEAVRELPLGRSGDEPVRVMVRARFTRRRTSGDDVTPPEDICVLFVEDVRTVQSRQRQDKLAAMGRVSAGIAHEIRNPLAAIAQATALLREDSLAPQQSRLADIVADNAERLRRIVDDVIDLAATGAALARELDLGDAVVKACSDWRATAAALGGPDDRLQLQMPAAAALARFDTEHLRRTLVNLLDNAARHANMGSGAIQVSVQPASNEHWHLDVASDGPPITLEVERYLFEPFFSTRSLGTGLGLYICRELCERNGATIEYVRQGTAHRHHNLFRVRMQRIARAG